MRKVLAPGIHVGMGNLRPAEAIPGAEVHLQQIIVNVMAPAPMAQLAPDGRATLQR